MQTRKLTPRSRAIRAMSRINVRLTRIEERMFRTHTASTWDVNAARELHRAFNALDFLLYSQETRN